jgi:hypothetical protein
MKYLISVMQKYFLMREQLNLPLKVKIISKLLTLPDLNIYRQRGGPGQKVASSKPKVFQC